MSKKELVTDQAEELIESIQGTMCAWESAELEIKTLPNPKTNLHRIGIPIVRGWYNFVVGDHASAKLIMHSFATQGKVPTLVTNEMNIKMLSMYRDPNVRCDVRITAYNHPIIETQVDIKNQSNNLLTQITATFQVLRIKDL